MIRQGEIYFADLNPIKGHEQSGIRPVLIVQNDFLNKNLNTVIIAPITTNLSAKGMLTTFFIDHTSSGLSRDSVALLFQIRTIDKIRLKIKAGKISNQQITKIREQLSFVF